MGDRAGKLLANLPANLLATNFNPPL